MAHGRSDTADVGNATAARLRDSSGFTLIELMVTLAIASILFAVAAWTLQGYVAAQQESTTAQSLVSTLRQAQERADAEGRVYCVSIDSTTSWSLWRYSCNPHDATPRAASKVDSVQASGTATVGHATFPDSFSTSASGSLSCASLGCAFFDPRGTASDGSVQVERPGSSSTYTIHVVGLTGRVYLTH